jgi:hypothetical protein
MADTQVTDIKPASTATTANGSAGRITMALKREFLLSEMLF